jgi:hypothetical protein
VRSTGLDSNAASNCHFADSFTDLAISKLSKSLDLEKGSRKELDGLSSLSRGLSQQEIETNNCVALVSETLRVFESNHRHFDLTAYVSELTSLGCCSNDLQYDPR